MAVDRTPVLKRCRQLGIDPVVMGINKTSNREPQRRRRQQSEYGVQLKEKQKAKFIYGVLEKQFRGYYDKAKKMQGVTGVPNAIRSNMFLMLDFIKLIGYWILYFRVLSCLMSLKLLTGISK